MEAVAKSSGTYKDIGSQLGLSPRTVKRYVVLAAQKIPGTLPPRVRVSLWWKGAAVSLLHGEVPGAGQ